MGGSYVADARISAVVLDATDIGDEPTTQNDGETFVAVEAQWVPAFHAKDGDPQRIEEWLRQRAGQWRIHHVRLPDAEAMERELQHVPRTAPGPGGILSKLWRVEALSAAQALTGAFHALASGARPAPGFNSAWLRDCPRVDPTDKGQRTARKAQGLRPLALKNTPQLGRPLTPLALGSLSGPGAATGGIVGLGAA